MTIDLSPEEQRVLWRYRGHLFKTIGISFHTREVLKRIIFECNEELNIVERDLKAEENDKR